MRLSRGMHFTLFMELILTTTVKISNNEIEEKQNFTFCRSLIVDLLGC